MNKNSSPKYLQSSTALYSLAARRVKAASFLYVFSKTKKRLAHKIILLDFVFNQFDSLELKD
jgi:hypothetical protein